MQVSLPTYANLTTAACSCWAANAVSKLGSKCSQANLKTEKSTFWQPNVVCAFTGVLPTNCLNSVTFK